MTTKIEIYFGDVIEIKETNNKRSYKTTILYCDQQYIICDTKKVFYIEDDYTIENIDYINIIKSNKGHGVIETNGWQKGYELVFTNNQTNDTMEGKINNIEDDLMILETLYGKKYIDFGYKGIPLWLNIEIKSINEVIDNDLKQEQNKVKKVFIFTDNNEIDLAEVIEVGVRKNKLYSIEEQLSDLKDEVLFKIPYEKRTLFDAIRANDLAEQYKYLRENAFVFDVNGSVVGIKANAPIHQNQLKVCFPTFIGNRNIIIKKHEEEEEPKITTYLFDTDNKTYYKNNFNNQCFVKNNTDNMIISCCIGNPKQDLESRIIKLPYITTLFESSTAIESFLPLSNELFSLPFELYSIYLHNYYPIVSINDRAFSSTIPLIPSLFIDKLKKIDNVDLLEYVMHHVVLSKRTCSVKEFITSICQTVGYDYSSLSKNMIDLIRNKVEQFVLQRKKELQKKINLLPEKIINWKRINPIDFPLLAAENNDDLINKKKIKDDEIKNKVDLKQDVCIQEEDWNECLINKECSLYKNKCIENKNIKRILLTDLHKESNKIPEIVVSNLPLEKQKYKIEKKWELKKKFKYNSTRIHQYSEHDPNEKILTSPFLNERNEILKEKNEKFRNIKWLEFCNKRTREASIKEEPNWLYCIETGTKLLPLFIRQFAQKYSIGKNEYNNEINKFIKTNGVYNEDNNTCIDVATGFLIKRMGFLTTDVINEKEHAYDEEEEQTRGEIEPIVIMYDDILQDVINETEDDLIDQSQEEITESIEQTKDVYELNKFIYSKTHNKNIYDTIQSICAIIGIFPTPLQYLNSLQIANENYTKSFMTKNQYNIHKKKETEKGKKVRNYEDIIGSIILFSSASSLALIITTSVPHIKSSRTVSGCLSFFTKEKITEYFSCVLKRMKQPNNPIFNAISKMKEEQINDALIKTINEMNNFTTTQQCIKERNEYDATNDDAFNVEEQIFNKNKSWKRFLPYQIINNHKNVNTKDISLNIQLIVNDVVSTQIPLLQSKNKKIFLENACCLNDDGHMKNVMDTIVSLDKRMEKILKMLQYNMEKIHNIISPYFVPDRTKWTNPTPLSKIEHKLIKDLPTINIKEINYPKLSTVNQSPWVKQLLNKITIESFEENKLINALMSNLNDKTNLLTDYLKRNKLKQNDINELMKKWKNDEYLLNTNEENKEIIIMWEYYARYCSQIIPYTIANGIPPKLTQVEQNNWNIKHWGISSRHMEDIHNILMVNINKYKPFYGKEKLMIEMKKINTTISSVLLDILYKLPTTKINNNRLFYLISCNICIDSIVSISKINIDVFKLILLMMNSFIELKKTIMKTEEQIKKNLFEITQKEKNLITSQLQKLTEEDRKLDNTLKFLKLGKWGKGLEKGLRTYDKRFYDNERQFIQDINEAGIDKNDDDGISNLLREKINQKDEDNELSDLQNLGEDWMNGQDAENL